MENVLHTPAAIDGCLPIQTDAMAPALMGSCTATTMCDTMAKRADPQAAKGFRPLWTLSRTEPVERFLGVAYFTDRKDKGLMLNTCPWCRGEPGHFKREC